MADTYPKEIEERFSTMHRLEMKSHYKAVGSEKTVEGRAIFDNGATVEIEDYDGDVHSFNKATAKFYRI